MAFTVNTDMQRDALDDVVQDMNKFKETRQTGEALWASVFTDEPSDSLPEKDLQGAQTLVEVPNWTNAQLEEELRQAYERAQTILDNQKQATKDNMVEASEYGRDTSPFKIVEEANEKNQEDLTKAKAFLDKVTKDAQDKLEALEKEKPTTSLEGEELKVREQAIMEIRQQARIDMMRNMNMLESNVKDAQIIDAQRRFADASSKDKDTTNGLMAETALLEKVRNEGPNASSQVRGKAKLYLEEVEKGREARESLRAGNLEQFVDSVKPELNAIFDKRIEEIRAANPMGERDDEIADIETERKKLFEKLENKSESLAGQMQFAAEKIEKNNDLGEEEKRKLRGQMLQGAIKYEGNDNRFAAEFFKYHQDDMAPVDLASLAKQGGLEPNRVFKIQLTQDDEGRDVLTMMQTGGKEITISDTKIVERAQDYGLDLKGMRKDLFVGADTSQGLSEDKQLALHETQGRNIRFMPTNGGRLPSNQQDYDNLTSTISNIVSVGDNDKGFNDNRTIRAYSMEVAGMEKQAQKMESLAKRAEAAQQKMAAAEERANRALPSNVREALGVRSSPGYEVAQADNSNKTPAAVSDGQVNRGPQQMG